MSFKILIVGCGAQGKVISMHMARAPEVCEIRLSDISLEVCKRHADLLKSDKVSTHRVDASNIDEVASLARGVDVVVNAVVPRFNLSIIDAALKNSAHYIDMAFGPPYENLDRELERSDKFKDAGLTAITGSGASPGVTNILAAHVTDKLDHVNTIAIRLAGSIEAKEPVSTWSPETLIADCVAEPVIFEDGKFKSVPPFSREETYTFPDPAIGTQTIYSHMHEEPFMLGRFIGKGLKDVSFKMGGPGMAMIKVLWEYGLLNDKPIVVKGVNVAPRDVFLALTPPTITMEELQQKVETGIIIDWHSTIHVEVAGEKDGKEEKHILYMPGPSLLGVIKTMPMATPLSYTTGTNCWILARMLGKREIKTTGLVTPERLEPTVRQKYLDELALQDPPMIVYERVEKRAT